MIKPTVERGILKVVCPKCKKLVDGKVEYDFAPKEKTEDREIIDIDVKVFVKCAECKTEIYAKKDVEYIVLVL